MNASELRNATPPPPPFTPSDAAFAAVSAPALFYTTKEDFMDQFRLIVLVLAVVIMAASLAAVTVTIVLVITVKRLQLLIGVLRSETRTEGVRAGLLEADAADAAAKNGGARGAAAGGGGKKKTRRQQTDTENTSCALEGVDEEDDHRL
jgi:hypothetical protein